MGTRGRYGFRYKGRFIIFYNHFDSYCDGLGQKIRDELAAFTDADFTALETFLKQHLRNGTLKEGIMTNEGGSHYEGLMKAAEHPKDYDILYVGREFPPTNFMIEYTYIVDLDKSFLRVITTEDQFKFAFHQLPPHMSPYDERYNEPVDTDFEETDEEE